MQHRDRIAAIVLIVAASVCWLAVAALLTQVSPTGRVEVQLAGALLIGLASGMTAVPLAWLAVFSRHRRIAYKGDWTRAARRGAWAGVVVALLVALRTQHAFSTPVALFVIVMVIFVEVSLGTQR
ncbi:MAG TPA: hypothetical protein VN800_04015 [Candidatus Acidoferrales bacterium]|nr:hypothetical protein [Candidatus Acidoferrales bacterium]